MIIFLKFCLWAAIAIVFYSYIGYGLFLWLYLKIFRPASAEAKPNKDAEYEPEVTIIVATYNEDQILDAKIRNCFELDYPKTKLKFLFVADGSTDNSVRIIKQYPEILLLHKPEREGKVAAINRAMPYVQTPFVIFCDANTVLNLQSVREIVRHYQDKKIGAVAGEKKIINDSSYGGVSGAGEGLYWKYESFLKGLDARFFTVVGAAGELFSIRTALYRPVESNVLLDDFIISMRICKEGYKVMYEPNAYASEAPSFSMKEEQKRKIRISAGGFQSVKMLGSLLNIFKFGKLSFQYISHRVLRWVVCPFLLPLIIISNVVIELKGAANIYLFLLIMQTLFYIAAAVGWWYAAQNIKVKLLYIPYYFVFMNIALYIGLKNFLTDQQTVLWEKAKRKT